MDDKAKRIKLWILKDWYLEVDEKGFYRGPLGEGVLGSVICLQGEPEDEAVSVPERGREGYPKKEQKTERIAWKLPRLLADTLEENAYIEGLLAQELKIVLAVRDRSGDPAQTLLHCRDEKKSGAFKGPRELAGTNPERTQQNNFVLFIQFEKALPPRLCLANFGASGLEVIPEGASEDLELVLTKEAWEKLRGDEKTPFVLPSFCAIPQYNQVSGVTRKSVGGTLEGAITDNRPLQAWYTGVASIQWDWAYRNLQEAIGEGFLEDWELAQHVALWKRILDGVAALHDRGYLHADLRPANIFCRGVGNRRVEKPDNFFVGDYGSFSAGTGAAANGGIRGGNTLIGPDVGRGRSSPFYSLERRTGIERESADTAVVIYKAESREYRIWIGWKSQVLDVRGNLKDNVIKEMIEATPAATPEVMSVAALDYLRPGDRIRLRDQVFKVKQAGVAEKDSSSTLRGGLYCICDGSYATVIHDRLTVRNTEVPDATPGPQIIPLSSFTELRQWSAATDMFSVGSLFLYTLYSSGRQKGYLPNTVKPDASQKLPSNKGSQALIAIDAEFRQLMMVIESVPYLRVLWPDLDYLWKTITSRREQAEKEETNEERSKIYSRLFDDLRKNPSYELSLPKNEFDEVRKTKSLSNIVSNITQSVPNIKVILQHFDWNMIRFVLFMHFILRCLHRKEHLGGTASNAPPFSDDRTDKPESGAARKAYEVLGEIGDLLAEPSFRDSTIAPTEVPDYDVRSEFGVKIENQQLRMENDGLKNRLDVMTTTAESLNRGVEKIKQLRANSKADGGDWGKKRVSLYAAIDTAPIVDLKAIAGVPKQGGSAEGSKNSSK
jgi:serine/threonine protein kinase